MYCNAGKRASFTARVKVKFVCPVAFKVNPGFNTGVKYGNEVLRKDEKTTGGDDTIRTGVSVAFWPATGESVNSLINAIGKTIAASSRRTQTPPVPTVSENVTTLPD